MESRKGSNFKGKYTSPSPFLYIFMPSSFKQSTSARTLVSLGGSCRSALLDTLVASRVNLHIQQTADLPGNYVECIPSSVTSGKCKGFQNPKISADQYPYVDRKSHNPCEVHRWLPNSGLHTRIASINFCIIPFQLMLGRNQNFVTRW